MSSSSKREREEEEEEEKEEKARAPKRARLFTPPPARGERAEEAERLRPLLTGSESCNLFGRCTTPEAVAAAAQLLEEECAACVTRVSFAGNCIGDDGARLVAGAMGRLAELDLSVNRIGVEGARAIADALRDNRRLRSLVLTGNPGVGRRGAAHIAGALATNATLERVSLAGCGAGAGAEIVRALETNLALCEVQVSGVNDSVRRDLIERVLRNRRLRADGVRTRSFLRGSAGHASCPWLPPDLVNVVADYTGMVCEWALSACN